MTPKQNFQLDKRRVSKHQDIVDKQETREGLLAAFNEYAWSQTSRTPQTSWDAQNRIQGAKEFIDVFLMLADVSKPRAADKSALEPETPEFRPVQPSE